MSIKYWTTRKNYTPFVVLYMSLQTDSQPLPLSVVRSSWFSGGRLMPSGSRATPLLRDAANRRPRGHDFKTFIEGRTPMLDLHYNAETADERAARKARASAGTSLARSPVDNLTSCERLLLATLRRQGYELTSTPEYPRYVRKVAA